MATVETVHELVNRTLDHKRKYEVRVQIVSGADVVLHTFPRELVVNSESRKCADYTEALAVYEDAVKQLGVKV